MNEPGLCQAGPSHGITYISRLPIWTATEALSA